MLSCSDDDDDPDLSVDDDAPLPAAQPLASLGRAPSVPATTATAIATATTLESAGTTPGPATTQSANGRGATLSDDSDDEHQLTTPASMPRHSPWVQPTNRDAEPYDAAEAAEQARRDASAVSDAQWRHENAVSSDATGAEVTANVDRVVDPALASAWIGIKGEKNDSVGLVPMEACVHGRTKNADGQTWPPYDITLPEARETQSQRTVWLREHLKLDMERLLTTILFFDVGPAGEATKNRIMALLPGRLVNPDANPDAAKRIAEYNECIANSRNDHDSGDGGPTQWFLGIPVPLQFVRHLYTLPDNGLPTVYDPNVNDAVKFVLVSKLEEQCARDARWRLIVDKSRDGANGGTSRGRRGSDAGIGPSRKRHKTASPILNAAAPSLPWTAAAQLGAATGPPATAAYPSITAAGPPITAADPPDDPPTVATGVPAPAPPAAHLTNPFPLATWTESAAPAAFLPTDLSWRSISPEWFAVVIPKIPRGYDVEITQPTHRCAGMVSFKQSSEDLDDL